MISTNIYIYIYVCVCEREREKFSLKRKKKPSGIKLINFIIYIYNNYIIV